ncbi:putative transcription factor C2H2 family [Helianthus annuus]|uniref:E3 ubiquitin-protein ligase ORTHRUS 2-like isoform X2 n=1 Tax=Helianthus annuus TaxID=4232 RepID=UPI000B8F71FE|nr:E3 ubiquitin-protein ligase ORTHRUS 2-like isoform X2 [Helianthus annuus]KAJ0568071.1 putative transcription factor C2H2 family [Helianthus annuus]KAJ0913031.1 putative transcription factor C2H2 family [Helianthus annuus]
MSVSERLLKEFCYLICHKVMTQSLTTPCAHNFCKSCLQDAFAGQTFIKERNCKGRRTLRAQKNVMRCPPCSNDISEYLQNPQGSVDCQRMQGLLGIGSSYRNFFSMGMFNLCPAWMII